VGDEVGVEGASGHSSVEGQECVRSDADRASPRDASERTEIRHGNAL